ncbi:MAG: hypothetical protein JXR49_08705 [Acidobacteria bacterium]|nr:hypothetical protein [Acidobacteriota bacterium]
MRRVHCLRFFILVTALVAMAAFFPRFSFAAGDDSKPLLFMRLSGTNYDPGWLFKLDTTAGYRFNRHFEITAGLPVYFTRLPDDTVEESTDSKNGIGNLYMELRVMADSAGFYFSSSLRSAAPTGNKEDGFSTGRMTVDWNNYFEYNVGRWTPFGSVGIANSISDTHFFTRPFSSYGIVGQFDGGLLFDPAWWVGFGGSVYAVVPSGEQEIYNRVYRSGTSGSEESGNRRGRIFGDSEYVIVESEDLRDHGFSGWVDIYPVPDVAFEFGYSRSVSYDLDSLYFSARFNFGGMIWKDRD